MKALFGENKKNLNFSRGRLTNDQKEFHWSSVKVRNVIPAIDFI